MHKNLKGRPLFHASASQGRMEACSFYKLHNNLRAYLLIMTFSLQQKMASVQRI